jgi:FMN phosphatase YigB (HAD superfamily)
VRAAVFDIGGVLIDWDPRHAYRDLLPDPAELDAFFTEVDTDALNAELDAGRPFADVSAEWSARHPDRADLIRAWGDQDAFLRGAIPGTAALVERLAAAGVPLHLITNMPRDVFDHRVATIEVLRRFDGAVVSGDHGILKPDAEIFRLALQRFGLGPGEAVFIDDKLGNVDAAVAAGFVGHHFVDADGLAVALEDLGLLC